MLIEFLKALLKILIRPRIRQRWSLFAAVLSLLGASLLGRHRFRLGATTCAFLNASDTLGLLLEIRFVGLYDLVSGDVRRIVDCGANIGVAALDFAQRFPQAEILCFEPSAQAFETLSANVKDLPRITIHNAALGASAGTAVLQSTEGQSLNMHVVGPGPGAGREEVRLVRLSDSLSAPVDLLKIDVEGSEHAILQDLVQSDKLRLVRDLIIEGDWNLPQQPYALSSLLALLDQGGFAYNVKAGASYWIPSRAGEYQTVVIYASRRPAP